jgi:hypothetical protein
MEHRPEDEVIKIIIEKVPPEVRGGCGFGISGYLDGRYNNGFQGFADDVSAVDHAIKVMKSYRDILMKRKSKSEEKR